MEAQTAYIVTAEMMQTFLGLAENVKQLREEVGKLKSRLDGQKDEVLSVEQVAKLTNNHPESIRRAIRQGRIKAVKTSMKEYGVLESEIKRYLGRDIKKVG